MISFLPIFLFFIILMFLFGWRDAIGVMAALAPVGMAIYFIILKIDQKRKLKNMDDF